MEIFIAGIIQGSCQGKEIHDQSYRQRLERLLNQALPQARVYCPFQHHPNSVDYPPDKAREVFHQLMQRAARADVLVAYIPHASMGTAIELWQGYTNDKIVLVISPLAENWVTKFLNTKLFGSLDEFEDWLAGDGLGRLIKERNEQ